jgi:hypothetical protein
MSRSLVLTLTAALTLGACSSADLVAPASGAGASLATASSGTFGVAIKYVLVGGGNVDWYSFEASDETGTLSGNFRMYQVRISKGDGTYAWATVDITGTVSCMKVVGNKARLGGVITRSNFAGLPQGTTMTWSVTDNGTPLFVRGRLTNFDAASSMFAGVDPSSYCNFGLSYPEEPLFFGNLTIEN